MEINSNSENTNQISPIPSQISSQPIMENHNNKLVKVILYIIGSVFFMVIGAFGYGYFQSKKEIVNTPIVNLPTQTPTLQQTQPILPTSVSSTPVLSSTDRVYRNNKYNFQFSYPQDRYLQGKLSSSYKLEEKGPQIIITETAYRSTGEKVDIPSVYTIYDANTTDKNNLTVWWQKNITTEIGGYRLPEDYNTALNSVPFDVCIKEYDKTWQLPSSLEVTPKKEVEEPGPYIGSIYFYYDFGKPFIMNFIEESTGACGGKDHDLIFTSISKLH